MRTKHSTKQKLPRNVFSPGNSLHQCEWSGRIEQACLFRSYRVAIGFLCYHVSFSLSNVWWIKLWYSWWICESLSPPSPPLSSLPLYGALAYRSKRGWYKAHALVAKLLRMSRPLCARFANKTLSLMQSAYPALVEVCSASKWYKEVVGATCVNSWLWNEILYNMQWELSIHVSFHHQPASSFPNNQLSLDSPFLLLIFQFLIQYFCRSVV